MKMTLSGTSYFAALNDVEPVSVTPVGYGCRVTLEVADEAQRNALIERLFVAACDAADDGQPDISEAIYKDIERSDRAAWKENATA